MIVYRICKKTELQKIFGDNNFTNVGYNFSTSDLNTHNYNKNSKYVRDLESLGIDKIPLLKH